MGTWRIDPGVAEALAALVGWRPDEGAVALTRALGATVPSGSTAKLAAVAAGEVPPGADPEAVARRVLADRDAGRPEAAWACWPMTTLMAALLTWAEVPCAVAAIRRIDATAPPVDFHSLVVVDGLLCDPYFSSVVAGPGADEVERTVGGVWCRREDEGDGRWLLEIGNGRWGFGDGLLYRGVAPALDRADVEAFCRISVRFSGAPPRRMAMLRRTGDPEDMVDAITHHEGTTAVRTWTWDADDIWTGRLEQVEHPDWPAATADFARRTGIPLL